MSRKQYIFVVFMALIGGIIGGTLSSKLFSNEIAYARKAPANETLEKQSETNPKKIVQAEEFQLVDKKNQIWAKLTTEIPGFIEVGESKIIGGPHFVMYGPQLDNSGTIKRDKDGIPIPDVKKRIVLDTSPYPMLTVINSKFDEHVSLVASDFYPCLRIGTGQMTDVFMQGGLDPQLAFSEDDSWIRISLDRDGLTIRDENKRTRAVLGKTELTDKSGSTIIRPLSSLVLFDENGYVKWSAP